MTFITLKQLDKLRHSLDKRQTLLAHQLRINTDERAQQPYVSLAGDVADTADAAAADTMIDTEYTRIGMEMAELRDIAAAQNRIESNSYGVCVDCEVPIRYSRLCAYPTAKRCTICQGVYEDSLHSPKHASM